MSVELTIEGNRPTFYPVLAPENDVTRHGVVEFDRITTGIFAAELRRRGVPFTIHVPKKTTRLLFRSASGARVWFANGSHSLNSAEAKAICTQKTAAKAFLASAGVPVARGEVFAAAQLSEALRYAELIGYPVALKRVDGTLGKGVFPKVPSGSDMVQVWTNQMAGLNLLLVEKHFSGTDHRFYGIDGNIIAVSARIPASVKGNGRDTVAELVRRKNELRRQTNSVFHKPIPMPNATVAAMVPAAGEQFFLDKREVPIGARNLVQHGADANDATEAVSPAIRELASRALLSIPGLRTGGLDMILRDPAGPASPENCCALEINHGANFGMHHFPWIGKPRNVAAALADLLLEAPGRGSSAQ